MIKITKEYTLFEFDELEEEAQEKALIDQINAEIELFDEESGPSWMLESIKEMEKMHTPWFLDSYILANYKQELIETIKTNEYLFFGSGELIPVDMYPN